MIKGKTKSGFNYKIDEKLLNDFEFIEMITELNDDDTILPKVITRLLGARQKKNLFNFLRTEDGIVPADKVMVEIEEIFSKLPVKKS